MRKLLLKLGYKDITAKNETESYKMEYKGFTLYIAYSTKFKNYYGSIVIDTIEIVIPTKITNKWVKDFHVTHQTK